MAEIISFQEAERPDFSEKQIALARELIGMGLTRLTIIGSVLQKDVASLTHAEISAGMRLIVKSSEELGYGVMDSRRANSPFMRDAVRQAAKHCKIRLRIA
jgi:hypothetical protein